MVDSVDKIDWGSMPEDATHFGLENNCWKFRWYKHINSGWVYWCHDPEWGYAFWDTAKRPGTKPLLRVADHHPNLNPKQETNMNKQKLIDRLAELQAEIEEVRAEIEKPKKWQPKGGQYFVNLSGNVEESVYNETPTNVPQFGMYCENKADAEELSVLVRSLARQFQWLKENDDGWVADWNDQKQIKSCVYYCHENDRYSHDFWVSSQIPLLVYMSEQNAKKLAAALNSGEVGL